MAKLSKEIDEPTTIVQTAWDRAHQAQQGRNDIYMSLYQRYKAVNPHVSDTYRSNLVTPKLYSTVETITPLLAKALFGQRPFFPMKSEKQPEAVEAIELALDVYLYKDGFKTKATHALKSETLFGTSFLEPYPAFEMVTVKEQVQQQFFPWGVDIVERQVPRFRLKTREWMPWQVYVEPNMVDLESPGSVITVEKVSKSEIGRLQELGRFKKFDLDKISDGSDNQDGRDFGDRMRTAIGVNNPADDGDHGILLRYMSNDRYITLWNGIDVLEDTDNPYKHKKINLVRLADNLDPMLQNSFWGQSEGKVVEGLMDKQDETWNVTFDNHDMINQAAIAYRANAVNGETLVMVGGVRIEVKEDFQGSIRDAIERIDGQGLPADHYRIPEVLDGMIDMSTGVFDVNRGQISEGDVTATEISEAASRGDLRNEGRIQLVESMALTRFTDLATSHIDQFAGIDDLFEVIGEKVLQIVTMNPQEIDDFTLQFKGSDSVLNDFKKRADWREIVDLFRDDPTLRPGAMLRETMQRYDMSDKEIEEIQYTDEELFQIQQQQIQLQLATAGGGGETPGAGKQTAAQTPTVANPGG